ncbi:WapI family immunity protein [Paenibacillus wenxiniae]|uniref:Uncharacterized protein n=1 Tax=Paenibacillus wenxiniae TaxID=1636843 RepID=A0ABW4RDF9_9BACL
MFVLQNPEKTITLSLNLNNNKFLDINLEREDFENWVPFVFHLDIDHARLSYVEEDGATFSLYELKRLLVDIEAILQRKHAGLEIERYEFSSCECYFDMVFYDTLEEGFVYMEVWINIGSHSNGQSFGYDKGVRFVASLSELENFKNGINMQLNVLLASLYS